MPQHRARHAKATARLVAREAGRLLARRLELEHHALPRQQRRVVDQRDRAARQGQVFSAGTLARREDGPADSSAPFSIQLPLSNPRTHKTHMHNAAARTPRLRERSEHYGTLGEMVGVNFGVSEDSSEFRSLQRILLLLFAFLIVAHYLGCAWLAEGGRYVRRLGCGNGPPHRHLS